MVAVAGKCNVQTWVDRSTRDQLAKLASAGDRTVSAELRRALVAHLEAKAADETREPVAAR